jgi:hypothetical protein
MLARRMRRIGRYRHPLAVCMRTVLRSIPSWRAMADSEVRWRSSIIMTTSPSFNHHAPPSRQRERHLWLVSPRARSKPAEISFGAFTSGAHRFCPNASTRDPRAKARAGLRNPSTKSAKVYADCQVAEPRQMWSLP